jgi:trehalose/maltose hydrolase-like predicted phosphorylase
LESDGIKLDPKLPASWHRLGSGIQWRNRRLTISIEQTKQRFEATLEVGEPMTLVVGGERHELRRDQTVTCRITRI